MTALPRPDGHLRVAPHRRRTERVTRWALFVAALMSVGVTFAIVLSLADGARSFFSEVPLIEYLTGTEWYPQFEPADFGVLPLVSGTLLVAAIAVAVAVPIGLATAVYLSEYASERLRTPLKSALEVLVGIPTVVYGFFALTFITPTIIRRLFDSAGTFNALAAGIVVGILTVPIVASVSEDSMRAVPRSLREAAYGLGSRRMTVALRVVFPAAISGILASVILAVARAIGETMAVTIAAGQLPQLTANPLEPIETMTAFMVNVSLGDTPVGSIEYRALFAVGATLFLITLALTMISNAVVRRFRQQYE